MKLKYYYIDKNLSNQITNEINKKMLKITYF